MAQRGRFDEMAWSDLQVVLAICRTGSLSQAAKVLGCNHSTVFRRIGAIEETVGVRFFERLPSGYAMTEAGQVAMGFAERIEAEFDALHREVTGLDRELKGHVIITAPAMLTGTLLPPMLADFRREHPGVTLEVVAGHAALDLRRRQADLAIRATKTPPGDYLGKRICDFRFGFYASREYLALHAERPLAEQDMVFLEGTQDMFVPGVWRSRADAEARTVFVSNSVPAVVQAAVSGIGMLPMSCYSCDPVPGLKRHALYPPMDMSLWLLMHPDLRHTARVKALMAFLEKRLRERAVLFAGEGVVVDTQ